MNIKRLVALAGATAGLVAAMSASSAAAAGNDAASLVALMNGERVRAGRSPLKVNPELSAYAMRHTREMAAGGSIWHTRGISRAVRIGDVVGENVGYQPDLKSMHEAFMGSQAHRSNVLDPDFSLTGVAVVEQDGWIYVTQIFAGFADRKSEPSRARATPPPSPPAMANDRAVGAANQTSILNRLITLDQSLAGTTAPRPNPIL